MQVEQVMNTSRVEEVKTQERGRELQAQGDMSAGSCVLRENACAASLRARTHNTAFCFLCCSRYSQEKKPSCMYMIIWPIIVVKIAKQGKNTKIFIFYIGSYCSYSFCSEECLKSIKHKLECQYLKLIEEYSNIHNNFNLLIILFSLQLFFSVKIYCKY